MPQPFKGNRRNITVRLLEPDAAKLRAVTDSRGETQNDLIASLVLDYLATVDLDRLPGQEALPIARAS